MAKTDPGNGNATASSHQVRSILGAIDADKLIAIMSLKPTVAEVERASLWLAGDADALGTGQPIKGKASDIVSILTADEEDEPPPAA